MVSWGKAREKNTHTHCLLVRWTAKKEGGKGRKKERKKERDRDREKRHGGRTIPEQWRFSPQQNSCIEQPEESHLQAVNNSQKW